MDRILDLPAHPLLVHFPVVAIPVLALCAVAVAFLPSFRRRYALPVAGLAVVTMISTFLATSSGEELSEILGAEEWIETHENLARQLTWMVVALTLGLSLVAGLDRRRPDLATAQRVLGGLVAVLGVLSLIWAVRTGHEGAKAHWEPIVPSETAEVSLTASESTTTTAADTDDSGEGSADAETDTATTIVETATTVEPETTTLAPETTTTDAAESTTTIDDVTTTTTGGTETTTTTAGTETTTTTGGTETTTTAGTETTTTTAGTDTSVPPVVDGMAVYGANCQSCHRADGSGARGPSLIGIAIDQPDPQTQVDKVLSGGGGMRAFAERLSAEEIDAVVAYIRETFV